MALRVLSRALLLATKSSAAAADCCCQLRLLSQLQISHVDHYSQRRNAGPVFSCQWSRWKSSATSPLVLADAGNLLQQMNVLQLRQDMEDEAANKVYISYSQLLHMCKSSGAASTRQEADALVKALVQAGVILRYQDIIYLRPMEVADIIFQALPGTKEETSKKLEAVESELAVLHSKHQTIESEARKWPNFFLYGGCVLLGVQLVTFARLTFYELSWDVMEPVAYFTSLFYTFIGYIYFLVFRNGFDLPYFEQYWKSRNKERRMKELNFDPQRYSYLLRLKERYTTHIAALGAAAS